LRLALVLAGAVVVFVGLALGVHDGGTFRWDRRPVDFFDEHYYDFETLRETIEAVVLATLVLGGALAVALFAALVVARTYRRALFWAATIVGVLLFTEVLKELVKRPEIGDFDTEYSFPSGNATAAMAAAGAVVLLLPPSRLRRIAVAASAVVVPLYGVALVLLLWHYPSDVVAGWALGLALVVALRLALGDVSGSLPWAWLGAHAIRRSSPRPR
jgi:membrane-associated phospholipid phosphatase